MKKKSHLLKKTFAMVIALAIVLTSVDTSGFVTYAEEPETVSECEHGSVRTVSDNVGSHKTECIDCTEIVNEGSCYDENGDNFCDLCGYEFPTPECQHESTKNVSIGDLKHNAVCTNCDAVVREAEDCVDEDDNGVCDKCGYEYPTPSEEPEQPEGCAHENVSLKPCGDYTHRAVCSDCMEYADEEAEDCFDDDEDGCCDACGFGETVFHEGISTYDSSEPNTCPVCGEPRATYYNSLVGGDAGVQTHASKCINGHVWGEDYCKFVNTTYSYAGKSGDKMRHMVICDVCGQNAYEKCTTFRIEDGKTYYYYPLSGSNSYCLTKHVVKCVYCSGHGGGTLTDFPNETEDMIRLGYIPSYDHTPTVTCNNDATHTYYCDECGLNLTKDCVNADGKKITDSKAWKDNLDGTHSFECSVCGYIVTESHTINKIVGGMSLLHSANTKVENGIEYFYRTNFISDLPLSDEYLQHKMYCSKCDNVTSADCDFSSSSYRPTTTGHLRTCSVCYDGLLEPHENFGPCQQLPETNMNVQNTHIKTCLDCGKEVEEVHNFGSEKTVLYHTDNSITAAKCNVCEDCDYEKISRRISREYNTILLNQNGGSGGTSMFYCIDDSVSTPLYFLDFDEMCNYVASLFDSTLGDTSQTVHSITIPVKEGAEFARYTYDNGTNNFDMVSSDGLINTNYCQSSRFSNSEGNPVTFNAEYYYKIYFDYDGGTSSNELASNGVMEGIHVYGSDGARLTGYDVNAKKSGIMVLKGFYTEKNGQGDKIINVPSSLSEYISLTNEGMALQEATTVYAYYAPAFEYHTITFDNGGVEITNESNLITKLYAKDNDSDYYRSVEDISIGWSAHVSNVIVPTPLHTEQYTFMGYYSQPNGNGERYVYSDGYVASMRITSDLTLYAYWKTSPVTVTFLESDGSVYQSTNYNKGASILTPTSPETTYTLTKASVFDRWALVGSGTKTYTQDEAGFSIPYSNLTDIAGTMNDAKRAYNMALYKGEVKYIAIRMESDIPYSFKWYSENGATPCDTKNGSFSECEAYTPSEPTKVGYVFDGWELVTSQQDAFTEWKNRGCDMVSDAVEIKYVAKWKSLTDIAVGFYNNPVNGGVLIDRNFYGIGDEVQIPSLSSYAANNASSSNFAKADYYNGDNFDYTKDYPIYKMDFYEWQLIGFDPALIASKGPQEDKLWGSGTPTSVLPLSALTDESYADVADAYANMLTNKEINYRAYFKRNGETKVNVKYVDYDGSVFQESGAQNFSDVVDNDWYEPIDKPVREGYTFKGWIKETDMTAARKAWRDNGSDFSKPLEVVYKAAYTINTCTITYVGFDGVTETEQVAYGGNPNPPDYEWEKKDGVDYKFSGWDKDIVRPVKENATYVSKWTPWYYIYFKDYKDSVIKAAKVKEGAMPTAPEVPSYEKGGYKYYHSGWEPAIETSKANQTYKATYTAEAIKVVATFVDRDGTEIYKVEVKKGDKPDAPSVEDCEDEKYTYTFKGWNPAVTAITKDTVFKAVYTKKAKRIPVVKEEPKEDIEPTPEPEPEIEHEVIPEPIVDEVFDEPIEVEVVESNPVPIEDEPSEVSEEPEEVETPIPEPIVVQDEEPEEETVSLVTEPEVVEEPEEKPKANKTVAVALATGAIAVALIATGALDYIWMLGLMFLFKRRKKFHGVLTMDDNRFVKLNSLSEGEGVVQEAIDNAGSFEEYVSDILGKTSCTYLPYNSKMSFSYRGSDGDIEVIVKDADEAEMFKELEALAGVGNVEVHIYNTRAKFDIPLHFVR